jgi:preprotein translocase subunit YajC
MEGLLLPLLLMLIVAVPLIMGTRKQKRAMQQQQELQNSLVVGDRVMTTSGLYATVADAADDTTIDLEIADGVVTTWLRQAVREKVDATLDDDTTESADDEATVTAEADENAATSDDERETAQVAPPLEHGKK